ncbi:MAG: hypothetical protein H7Y33_17060 [Cytophagales bacterium]|nr:hypothetical protein [Rhizobacter sp.]
MVMPSERERTTLPGWKAILVREETFRRLQSIQRSTIDPHLDLRYLGDAAVLLALDTEEDRSIVRRACDEMRRHL